jgi:Uma2 family endonuclease
MPHPDSFPWLFEWYRRVSPDEILQIGVVLSLDAFPGFELNRALLQLDPSCDSPSLL